MREAKAIARQARVNSIDGGSPIPSSSSSVSAVRESSSAIPSSSTAVQGRSSAIPSCSTAVTESLNAVRISSSAVIVGSPDVSDSLAADPIILKAVQGSSSSVQGCLSVDQSIQKSVPSSSSASTNSSKFILGRSAVPGSLSSASSSPKAVPSSSPSATNSTTSATKSMTNGSPSKNSLNLPLNGNHSEKLDSINGTNQSNGDKERNILLIKQNNKEGEKSLAKPKQEKDLSTAKTNSTAAHQPPAKATSLDSHLPSAKLNSQLLLQRLKSVESPPVPLNLKIEALSTGI